MPRRKARGISEIYTGHKRRESAVKVFRCTPPLARTRGARPSHPPSRPIALPLSVTPANVCQHTGRARRLGREGEYLGVFYVCAGDPVVLARSIVSPPPPPLSLPLPLTAPFRRLTMPACHRPVSLSER